MTKQATHREKNNEMKKKIAVWPSRCQSGGQDKTGDEIYETTQLLVGTTFT